MRGRNFEMRCRGRNLVRDSVLGCLIMGKRWLMLFKGELLFFGIVIVKFIVGEGCL